MKKTMLGADTLLYPMPAVLVGTKVDEKPNFMTAAWCGIAAPKPPALGVSIRKELHTFTGIMEHKVFSINVASAGLARKVDYCGIYSGRKRDKSQVFKVFYGVLEAAPLVEECPVNLACRMIHTLDLGSHTLIVGEIVESYVNEDCLSNGKPDPVKIDPLIYTTITQEYRRLGDVVARAFHDGKTLQE
ncbi:MAG TPA: flavin reductase family protein [Desulfobacteraceae bacterium]|nr:flavin reductase family protein [Desulfobacteraceae bacterium]